VSDGFGGPPGGRTGGFAAFRGDAVHHAEYLPRIGHEPAALLPFERRMKGSDMDFSHIYVGG
jgi:hypothetical protein